MRFHIPGDNIMSGNIPDFSEDLKQIESTSGNCYGINFFQFWSDTTFFWSGSRLNSKMDNQPNLSQLKFLSLRKF